ncbi:MAG: hypothetical protein M0008_05410 [Actinomycetota bacterium]|jgi:hypothetical protein|nr:hypothetical protein [Actinomycetota bacterium]
MAIDPSDSQDLVDEIRKAIAADAVGLAEVVDLLTLLRMERLSRTSDVPREAIWHQIFTRIDEAPRTTHPDDGNAMPR